MTARCSAMAARSSSQRQCQHEASTCPALTAALGGPSITPSLEACRPPAFLQAPHHSHFISPICAWASAVPSLEQLCSPSAQSPFVPHPSPLCPHGEGAHPPTATAPRSQQHPSLPLPHTCSVHSTISRCSCTSVAQPKPCQSEDGRRVPRWSRAHSQLTPHGCCGGAPPAQRPLFGCRCLVEVAARMSRVICVHPSLFRSLAEGPCRKMSHTPSPGARRRQVLPVPQCRLQGPAALRWEPNDQGRGNDVLPAPPVIAASHPFFQPHVCGCSWTGTRCGLECSNIRSLCRRFLGAHGGRIVLSPRLTQPSWQQRRCPRWDCLHRHLFAVQRSAAVTISDERCGGSELPRGARRSTDHTDGVCGAGRGEEVASHPKAVLNESIAAALLGRPSWGYGRTRDGVAAAFPAHGVGNTMFLQSQTRPCRYRDVGNHLT